MWQPLRRLPIVGATLVVIAFATQAMAATTPTTYTVGSTSVLGTDTGLVLKKNRAVTITATGTVCPGVGWTCATPDGNPSVDTAGAGFLQPQAPAFSLVARVGSGAWTFVGSGPKKIAGTGDLFFAFNDNLYPDNVGSFEVTVSYSKGATPPSSSAPCQPGWGKGDTNHVHTGPPGSADDACYPGHGYGDKNHDHDGPPGQNKDSDEHGKGSR
jgi:hypothetical protein